MAAPEGFVGEEGFVKKQKSLKKRIIILVIVCICLAGAGGYLFHFSRTNPRVRLLMSVLHFEQSTLKNPAYLLYDVDIMEVCREYANGDITYDGRVGLWGMEQVRSSIYFDVSGARSFSQKRLTASTDMSLLWIELGDLDFFAEDETVYMLAPLLGDDVGYAFPTGQNLFMKMPDLTHDIDAEWFKDHVRDIIDLTGEMTINQTGEMIVDEDGKVSDQFIITMPVGCGDFIWELLGMEAPDYDVVVTMYLTEDNHLRRMEMDLSEEVPGASVVIDGEDIGTAYLYYELPDDERVEMKAVRNADAVHRVDMEAVYFANNGKEYTMTAAFSWEEEAEGVVLRARDLVMKEDGKTMAEGYFKGNIRKADELEDLFGRKASRLYALEELDWKKVRDDSEEFADEVLSKADLSLR